MTALTDLGMYAYALARHGGRLLCTGQHSGNIVIWTSDNLGTTWTKRTVEGSTGTQTTQQIARTQDGRLILISSDASSVGFWSSPNGGLGWVDRATATGYAVERGPWR